LVTSAERSSAKRAQFRKLHADGLSASAIARELGVAKSTISRWAKADGIGFDRAKTAEATAAKSIDLAAARTRLAEKMAHRAEQLLDSLDGEYLVYSFGGRDNTYSEHLLKKPPVEVIRNAVTTAGITFDKLTRIVEKDPDVSGAASVVQSLEAGILAAAEVLRAPGTETIEEA
jgi:transcriptional regulator with XRE-family HTH domain